MEKKKFKKENIIPTIKKLFKELLVEPFYILTHPIKGFYEFKTEKLGKNYVAIFYIIMLCFTQVLKSTQSGYLINPSFDISQYNVIVDILYILVPVGIGVVGNWSITTLFDGKGKFMDIFRVIGYAACPFVLITIPNVIYSNFLISEEIVFYTAISTAAVVLFSFMIFFGLLGIHEYGLIKTVVTVLATVISVAVILFFVFIITTLIGQVYGFAASVVSEFILKYL